MLGKGDAVIRQENDLMLDIKRVQLKKRSIEQTEEQPQVQTQGQTQPHKYSWLYKLCFCWGLAEIIITLFIAAYRLKLEIKFIELYLSNAHIVRLLVAVFFTFGGMLRSPLWLLPWMVVNATGIAPLGLNVYCSYVNMDLCPYKHFSSFIL